MSNSFIVGDVVKLKSGISLPIMIVEKIEERSNVYYVTCIWWNNHSSEYFSRLFISNTLVKV